MYDLKDFKAADHIPALLDWMRAQMKGCGGKTAVVGISGGKDSSVIAALCVEAYGRENVLGVLMPDGVQPDIDYSNGIVDFLGIKHYTFNIHGGTSGILGEMARLGIEASRQTTVNLPSRIRMATLYAIAQSVDAGIVVNTSPRIGSATAPSTATARARSRPSGCTPPRRSSPSAARWACPSASSSSPRPTA